MKMKFHFMSLGFIIGILVSSVISVISVISGVKIIMRISSSEVGSHVNVAVVFIGNRNVFTSDSFPC